MTITQLLGVVCLGVACALLLWVIVKADRGADRRADQHRQALKRLFPDGHPERDSADQHLLDLYFPHDPPAAAGLKSERQRLDRAVVPFKKRVS